MAMNLIETIDSHEELDFFHRAIQQTGMQATLRGRGPYTVIAPTDRAFAELDDSFREALFDPQHADMLEDFVCAHIFNEGMRTEDLEARTSLTPLSGDPVTVHADGGQTRVGQANIVRPNVPCSNGVLHTSDQPVEQPDSIGDMVR